LVGVNLADGSAGTAGLGVAGAPGCTQAACQDRVYECGDCEDNDQDGLVDSFDPDCLGACDNTEDSFFGGIPGANEAPCKQDCYFDRDTGSGNDDCHWSHRCDPLAVAPDYPPSGDEACSYDPAASMPGTELSCSELESAQSEPCLSLCLPLTPNGCDCFGCCELPPESGSYVWIGSSIDGEASCTRAALGDREACRPCTLVFSCYNPCEHCEICVDKPTLPPDCATGGAGGSAGVGAQCSPGVQPCGQPDQDPCPSDYYCISGCCIELPR
jgi:hypothetical protein